MANLVFAEAFIASHLGQSTTAAMAPRSRADARIPLRGRAETARAESRSCDENSVLGTETPLEDKGALSGCFCSRRLQCFPYPLVLVGSMWMFLEPPFPSILRALLPVLSELAFIRDPIFFKP